MRDLCPVPCGRVCPGDADRRLVLDAERTARRYGPGLASGLASGLALGLALGRVVGQRLRSTRLDQRNGRGEGVVSGEQRTGGAMMPVRPRGLDLSAGVGAKLSPVAKRAAKRKSRASKAKAKPAPRRGLRIWVLRVLGGALALALLAVLALRVVNPPVTHTIWTEARRLGGVERQWVPAARIAPVMLRAVVAAEDANFCRHWGFDMAAIRDAIAEGGQRGASTLSQQVVKNVFLWQGRSWVRKALEAGLTPVVEALWPKRRILEVYLNVAEFGEGVFGVEAAARRYYGIAAADLSPVQAARLAVLLPNPRSRDPRSLSPTLLRRAARIAEGAATIRADGRAACFES